MKDVIEVVSDHRIVVAVAGAAGAAIYLLHEGKELGWPAKITTVLAGAAVAHFLTHPILKFFNLYTIDDGPGTGFILGLFGMSLFGAGLRLARAIDWELVRSFLPGAKK